MLPRKEIPSDVEIRLIAGFDFYRKEILDLQAKAKHDEDVTGESDKFCTIQLLHLFNYLGMLIYLRAKDGLSYSELEAYFSFSELQNKMACLGYSFTKLLETYHIHEVVAEKGVGAMEIDNDFIVGGGEFEEKETVDIQEYLQIPEEQCCFVNAGLINVLGRENDEEAISTEDNQYIKVTT